MKEFQELLKSNDENERKQALSILFKNPTPENVATISRIAENDPNVDIRFLAKRAFNLLKEKQGSVENKDIINKTSLDKIREYLSGPEKGKLSVIQHIINNGIKQAHPLLIEQLEKETDTAVIASLIVAIGKTGDITSFRYLKNYLQSENPRIRANAVEAAGLLGTTEAYPQILKLLEDPDNRVRANSIMVIKNLGLVNTIKVIKDMAESDSIGMKASAAFTLRFFPAAENIEILEKLLESDDLNVKNGALSTLQIFKEKGITEAEALLTKLGSNAQIQSETLNTFEKVLDDSVEDSKTKQQQKSTPEPLKTVPPKSLPDSQKTSAITSESEKPEENLIALPEKYIGSSGRGALAEHLKPFATQTPQQPGIENSLDQILVWGRTIRASDIHLSPGKPILYRQFGLLKAATTEPFTHEKILQLIGKSGIDMEKVREFNKHGDLEVVVVIKGAGRFRVTLMKHLSGINITARIIPWVIQTFDETGMPQSCKGLIKWAQGLVLITGPSGSGKTSTLATLVEMINQTRKDHIITIERPVEIVYEPSNCQISQREIGCHTASQHSALKGALREDPDIIVVSELRDLDTIQLAISAAETGHLVFGTMNTVSAARTVSRITDSFAPEEQSMLQNMLSESLRGIICQQLIPRKDGTGVVPAYEVMIVTTAVSNMIRKEGIHQLASVMTLGKSSGMVTMDQSLRMLAESGVISGEEAYLRADSKREFMKFLPKEGL
ncbi:MAG: PilT/PilU family type 4a pilus ATPase [Candidatus Riflebacteria bacterium]|nr:PilT/PilU family type 4a pilus ATPase [Candidatus Riflebacteria bacterium]